MKLVTTYLQSRAFLGLANVLLLPNIGNIDFISSRPPFKFLNRFFSKVGGGSMISKNFFYVRLGEIIIR